VTTLPNSSRAQCLPAIVLAHVQDEDEQKKAKEILAGILKKDTSCLDAVLALTKLYRLQEKYDEAIAFLKEFLGKHNKDFLHTAMGDVLVAAQKFDEASIHYAEALKINPLCEVATQGLEAIERLVNGGAEDREEEGEEEDEEEFQAEGETAAL